MAFALPAAATATAAAATTAAASATMTTTLIAVAKSVALNAVISAAMSALQPQVGTAGRTFEWTLDPNAPIPFAAGRVGVAGTVAHLETYGPDKMYYGFVSVLSGAGPVRAITGFKGDDEVVTFDANGKAISSQWANEMWFRSRLGTQPDTALTNPPGLKNNAQLPGWTAAHKLSGKASYMLVLGENSKRTAYPTGEPKPLVTVEGLFGWDPRQDSTYPGGAGTCRLDDPATWVWLDNPILWGLKWALGLWEGPVGKGAPGVDYQVGGIGAKVEGIDVAAFVAAANVADANGWKVAAYPTTDDDKAQVLDSFLQAGGAIYAQRAGKISCIQRAAPRPSIATITAADTAGPLAIDTAASRIDRINTIRPRFWSEAHRWQMTAIDDVSAEAYRTEDGAVRPRGIDYNYVPLATQAAQLAALQIANTREPIAGTIPLKPHMRNVKPGVAFTISEPGFLLDGLKCLCLNSDYDPASGVVTVTFVSETDAKYPFALGQSPVPPAPPVLTPPNLTVTPPQAGEWTLAATTFTGGGVSVPALLFEGEVENARAISAIFEFRPVGAADWSGAGIEDPTVTRKEAAGGLLTAGVQYEGAVSYRVGGVISDRLILGPVTAGTLTAGEVAAVTPANVGGAPSIAITVGHDGDGTAVNLLAANWADAANALSYVVELETAGVSRLIDAPESSLSNVRVQAGQACRYRVKGKSRTGHLSAAWSAWSATQVAAGDTTAPGVVGVVGVTALARRCIVQWTAPADADLSHFEVARNTTGSGATLAADRVERNFRGTIFTDTNVSVGGSYYYWVRPVDRTGNVGAWVFIGAGTPTFIRVDLGDVGPTDPTLVTEYGIAAGIEFQGSGATANTLAQLNPGEGTKFATIAPGADKTNTLTPSSGVTAQGNGITNTIGSGAFVGVKATPQRGPCFVEMDIATGAYAILALDLTGSDVFGSTPFLTSTAYMDYHAGSGGWSLWVAGSIVRSSGATAGMTGKVRLEYDGYGFRALIGGQELAYGVSPASNITTLHPVAYAYHAGVSYTGVNSGALSPRDASVTLVPLDGTAILKGNSLTKSSTGVTDWVSGGAYSREWLLGSASCSFRSAHAMGDMARAMAGLSDNIGEGSYENIDYAFYLHAPVDGWSIWENGAQVYIGAAFTPNTQFQITYDGDKVRYWVDGTVVRTVQTTFGRHFRFLASMYDAGTGITDIQWRPSHQVSVLGQNTVRPDTGGLVPQAEIRTPEGVAAGYSGQTAWGTYGDYTPSQIAPRVAAGLNALGDIQRPIPGLVRQLSDIPAYDELIAFDGSDTIGFDPLTPTSPIDTVGNVLRRGPLHVESEGAVGDGIADDTAAIQAALNTGRDVFLTAGKVYKVTSPLTMSTNYQRFIGPSAELKAVGNFDVLTVTGGIRGAEVCLTWHSPDHTGGWSLRVINADRTKIRAYFVNVWGGLYVQRANVCSVEWLYGSFRGPGIKWWGNAANRSDLLTLKEVYLGLYGSPTNQDYGLDWDGNCHSLEIKLLTIVNAAELGGQRRAMVVRNTAAVADPGGGHPHPIIARVGHLEIDYPYGHGIEFLVPAHDFDLMMPYIHACNGGSGIKLSSSADGKGSLRIHGGKIDSNSRYAIENDGPSPVNLTNTQMFLNTLGDVHGPAQTQTPRLQIDDQLYLHVDAGNPLMGFDANDYILYSRGANFWEFMIGGTRRALIDAQGLQAAKLRLDDDAYLALSGGNPILNFDANDTLGFNRSGNEFFFNIGGTKRLGIADSGSSVLLNVADDAAFRYNRTDKQFEFVVDGAQRGYFDRYGTLWLNGDVRAKYLTADGWFFMYSNNGASDPGIWVDENDRFVYNRAGNYLEFQIATVAKFTVDGDGVKAPGFRVDDQLRFYLDGSMALVRLDSTDALSFNRSTNTLTFEIGSSPMWKADAAQFEFLTPTKHKSYTVAALPTGASGLRALVTDAVSPTFGATVNGGGTITVPVFHDGASWKVG